MIGPAFALPCIASIHRVVVTDIDRHDLVFTDDEFQRQPIREV